jgi:NitT/TauT family transport system ATP-binding protein
LAGPVISARELSLVFQTADAPVYALSKVNLEVEDGDFVSFIGPSGCGKTTLLRVIADLEQATSGTITVNGMTPQEARLKRAYGYVFQAPALYPWRTVERNVGLPLEIMGLDHAAERIAKNLELVNLKGFEKKYPWQLSGGMQQRVSICRALIHEPKMLLLDEPFGALDALTRGVIQDELLKICAATAQTVFMITHDVDEAILLADKIMLMSNGPGARIAEIVVNTLPRDRSRHTIHKDPQYYPIRNHLVDFLVSRSKSFTEQPPVDFDPLHPPLVTPGLADAAPAIPTSILQPRAPVALVTKR